MQHDNLSNPLAEELLEYPAKLAIYENKKEIIPLDKMKFQDVSRIFQTLIAFDKDAAEAQKKINNPDKIMPESEIKALNNVTTLAMNGKAREVMEIDLNNMVNQAEQIRTTKRGQGLAMPFTNDNKKEMVEVLLPHFANAVKHINDALNAPELENVKKAFQGETDYDEELYNWDDFKVAVMKAYVFRIVKDMTSTLTSNEIHDGNMIDGLRDDRMTTFRNSIIFFSTNPEVLKNILENQKDPNVYIDIFDKKAPQNTMHKVNYFTELERKQNFKRSSSTSRLFKRKSLADLTSVVGINKPAANTIKTQLASSETENVIKSKQINKPMNEGLSHDLSKKDKKERDKRTKEETRISTMDVTGKSNQSPEQPKKKIEKEKSSLFSFSLTKK